MKLKNKITTIALASVLGLAGAANGQSLFTIDFSQTAPNQVIASAANVSVSDVTLTAGSIAYGNFGSTFGGVHDFAESSQNWTATNFTDAKKFTFTVTADSGFEFSLADFSSLLRSTNAGPQAGTLIVNGTDYATIDLVNSDGQSFDAVTIGLSGLTTATIEIAGWLNGSRSSSGGGAFRIGAVEGIGSVSVVPEPGSYALLAGLLGMGYVMIRRRRA